ncbi:MAG: hypothetical protein ABI167_06025 [Nitrosospira sp.]
MRTGEALAARRASPDYPDLGRFTDAVSGRPSHWPLSWRRLPPSPVLYPPDNYREAVAAVVMGGFEFRVTRFESGFLRITQRGLGTPLSNL